MPMDACHLLLGHPWQYGKKVMHDGYKNTYCFEKDGLKVTLGPSKTERITKPFIGEGSNLLYNSQFDKTLKGSNEAYALMVMEENEEKLKIPSIMQLILEEFHDIVVEEIPLSLPPWRDIQHCIDFIPRAVLPNKAAYRMNPKENEELQRQVKESMAKGLLKESMSPWYESLCCPCPSSAPKRWLLAHAY